MSRLITLIALAALPLHAGVEIRKDGKNLEVHIDGKLFTEYHSETTMPCLHPLMSPTGTHLTRQYPFVKGVPGEKEDHPHHTGFWFTHGSVNGKDFWHSRGGARIVTKGFIGEPKVSGDSASFTAEIAWEVGGKRVLSEQRTYTITAAGKTRTVDVTIALSATEGDVVFGDTKEGSFAIRVAPSYC